MSIRLCLNQRHVATAFVMAVLAAIAALVVPCDSNAAGQSTAAGLPLTHVVDVPLPGRASRLDYESIDPDRHLLFIAHLGDSEVIVFDTEASRVVARIGGISEVHWVLVLPELSRVYASATGSNEVVAIDEATLEIAARIPGGVFRNATGHSSPAKTTRGCWPVLRVMASRLQ